MLLLKVLPLQPPPQSLLSSLKRPKWPTRPFSLSQLQPSPLPQRFHRQSVHLRRKLTQQKAKRKRKGRRHLFRGPSFRKGSSVVGGASLLSMDSETEGTAMHIFMAESLGSVVPRQKTDIYLADAFIKRIVANQYMSISWFSCFRFDMI